MVSHFAGSKGQIHAFEPTPSTFQRLAATVRNFNRNNVKINNVAVNDKSGFVTFNVYEEAYASWNTMATRPLENYGVNIDAPNAIQVAAVTIDEYCYNENIKEISLLKIDVEGAELNVLEGASKMFKEKKVRLCAFEFGQTIHDMGKSGDDFRRFFDQHGYQIRNIVKGQAVFPVDSETNAACFSIHFSKPK